jgi:DNA topoisomerase-1
MSMTRLRRSDPSRPGLQRRRAGRGFVYRDLDGRRIADPDELARIRALAIPPAWQAVWICPWSNGHIQALGTDARGRRQYRYHDAWRAQRDREKFERMLDLARALPDLRAVCARHLALPGMPKEKALACAVRLLDVGFFRVGGEDYAEENGSYGLATLLKRHARVAGDHVVFEYPAKSGRFHYRSVVDPEVRDVVAALKRRRGGGPELLAYRGGRRWVDVRSDDINDYLREISNVPATAKDFRTWNATVLAAVALAVSWRASSGVTARRRAVHRASCEVASYLGNTPAVCRSAYIDPRVIDLYLDGVTIQPMLGDLGAGDGVLASHGAAESAVLALLEDRTDELAA